MFRSNSDTLGLVSALLAHGLCEKHRIAMQHLAVALLSLLLFSLVSCGSTVASSGSGEKPECADGEVARSTCVECGPTDKCVRSEVQCFPTCETVADCEGGTKHYDTCSAGVCTSFACG